MVQAVGEFLVEGICRLRPSKRERDRPFKCRGPLISLFCRWSAQARIWREQLSARDLKCELSDLRGAASGRSPAKWSMERTSPADPRAM